MEWHIEMFKDGKMTVSKVRKEALIWELNEFLFVEQKNLNPNTKDKIRTMIKNLKAMGEK